MSIEDRLQLLREEWRQRPDKRAFIEKQAALLKKAAVRLVPDPEFEKTIQFARDLFSGKVGAIPLEQNATG